LLAYAIIREIVNKIVGVGCCPTLERMVTPSVKVGGYMPKYVQCNTKPHFIKE